jgi:chromate transporter
MSRVVNDRIIQQNQVLIGTAAALCGFLAIPWTVGLSLGVLYLKYADLIILRNILAGIAATAAGLLIATGIRLLRPYRRRPATFIFAALGCNTAENIFDGMNQ